MRLYNTLTRNVQDFAPLNKRAVTMYHCGPTVYNYAHIGNLRAYVFADTIKRSLKYLGFSTNQIINITDVGHLTSDADYGRDKVEEEAIREQKSVADIVSFYTQAFFDDITKLNIDTSGTTFPKATDHIAEQIQLIETLEKRGFTYKTSDGVYFDTSKFPRYGKLGNIDLESLKEGARITANSEKKHPTDFALWKFSPADEKRAQEWPSPWGVGFPGWHIECSAMAMKYLGHTIDIHTGGIDHIPTHHNNEIAQSEAATGKDFAQFWMHNAFVNIAQTDTDSGGGSKMSKSKGNFIRLNTLSEHGIHPLAYRYWLLTAHYRSPVTFSFEAVSGAARALESLAFKLATTPKTESEQSKKSSRKSYFSKILSQVRLQRSDNSLSSVRSDVRSEIARIISNDLDTPGLIALLHKTVDDIVAGTTSPEIIKDFDAILGLRLIELSRYMNSVPEKIKNISNSREEFRKAKNWAEADSARKELENAGYLVDDTPQGPRIYRSMVEFS
jgi:cysteinyl-tRNA synthetase